MMEDSLQAAICRHIEECVVKLHSCQIFRNTLTRSALKDQKCSNKDKLVACWINFPIAICVIAHEHINLYDRVFNQISKYSAAVNMIDPDNSNVGLMTVLDVIEEIIGDNLYQFIEYCMAKYEKVMSLGSDSKRFLHRRYQAKLF